MVGTITIAKAQPFENQTIGNPTFEKARITNVSVFQKVRFQIPTVDLQERNKERINIW